MEDRILVFVVMGGGNDGLNTLIPLDSVNNPIYESIRPGLKITAPVELDAGNGAIEIGVHPAASALVDMFGDGKAAIVQGVHYPSANKSHFIGTDIKIAALDGTTQAQTGHSFLGEYLNIKYPNYPASFPNVNAPNVLGLGLGFGMPQTVFNRKSGPKMGITLKGSPTNFRNLVTSVNQPQTNPLGLTASKRRIAEWYAADSGSNAYSQTLADAYAAGANIETYAAGRLSEQLKDIARLIGSGSKTKIYVATIGGFDTHDGQGAASGDHANLLGDTFNSIKTFLADLNSMGTSIANRVLVQTFSEFGRQVIENGSGGTDHGTQNPVFIFGNGVNGGVIGANPDLTDLTGNDYATYQYDYRQIYAGIMAEWLGAGPNQLAAMGLTAFAGSALPVITDTFTGTRDLAYI